MRGHQLPIGLIHGVQIQVDQGIAEEQSSQAHHHYRNAVGDGTATSPSHCALNLTPETKLGEDNISILELQLKTLNSILTPGYKAVKSFNVSFLTTLRFTGGCAQKCALLHL